jgi:hypothetical protein
VIAREAMTVLPMDQPEIVRPFLMAVANVGGNEVSLPNLNSNVSGGTQIGVSTPVSLDVPSATDLLDLNGLDSNTAHLQKDFQIVGVSYLDGAGDAQSADILVEPDDDGNFSFSVDVSDAVTDYVSGNVNFFSGVVNVSNTRSGEATSVVTGITIVASISGFEEMYANKISFKHLKIHLNAIDHEVQAEWSIQYEQDVKAYFDFDVQAQLVDTFGNVVALDIDRKLIGALINETNTFHSSAVKTFSKTPDAGFAFGRKEWYNQIAVTLNEVSNQIYVDTNMGTANTIIANPLDVAVLRSTSDYNFKGNTQGGEYGSSPIAGTFDESWKVLSSPVVPQGKMVTLLKPENPDHAVFVFAPYRPLTITPYPLGRKPSMSFLSRYAAKFIRHEGAGIINITN